MPLRILVATDSHLGFLERDPVRGGDSFRAFEEMLQLARSEEADMVLLGGDLFHENKPSRQTLHRTMALLRKYCFGDGAVELDFVSDPQGTLHSSSGFVNFADPNVNVELPVFSIHGNHDDPSGDGGLAALDLLAVSNYVNYFGKSPSIEEVKVRPLLLHKGEERLALYGLGNIRDERLHRVFEANKVAFERPDEDTDAYFNLFVLHQNRVNRRDKNHVHESMLPGFLHLVMWGHEHECLIQPTESASQEFFITQPGSSVATSLVEGERRLKHAGLLEIRGTDFRMTPLRLQTVRPFVGRDVTLEALPGLEGDTSPEAVERELVAIVEALVQQGRTDPELVTASSPELPIVRVRVEYTGFGVINPVRFGQRFVGKVANPSDILHFHRRAVRAAAGGDKAGSKADAAGDDSTGRRLLDAARMRPTGLDPVQIGKLVTDRLKKEAKLKLLLETELTEAVDNFVLKEDIHAIEELLKRSLAEEQERMQSKPAETQDDVARLIMSHREERIKDGGGGDAGSDDGGDGARVPGAAAAAAAAAASMRSGRGASVMDVLGVKARNESDNESMDDVSPPGPAKRKRAPAKKKTSTRGKQAKDLSDDDNDDGGFGASRPAAKRAVRKRKSNGAAGGSETQGDDDNDDDDYNIDLSDAEPMAPPPAKKKRTAPKKRAAAPKRKPAAVDLDDDDDDDDDGDGDVGGIPPTAGSRILPFGGGAGAKKKKAAPAAKAAKKKRKGPADDDVVSLLQRGTPYSTKTAGVLDLDGSSEDDDGQTTFDVKVKRK